MKLLKSLIIILVFSIHCQAANIEDKKNDVAEKVFRYLIQEGSKSVSGERPDVYFLTLLDNDPPKDLFNRFSNNSPPVRAGFLGRGKHKNLYYMLCEITDLQIKSDSTAIVVAICDDGFTGISETIELKLINNQWEIIRIFNRIIGD